MKNKVFIMLLMLLLGFLANGNLPFAQTPPPKQNAKINKLMRKRMESMLQRQALQDDKKKGRKTNTNTSTKGKNTSKKQLSYAPNEISPDSSRTASKRVELIYAGVFEGLKNEKGSFRIVRRDSLRQVQFRHGEDLLFCDSAYHQLDSNFVTAYGDVKIEQGDSISIVSDTLYYDGYTRLAQFRGNVLVKDTEKVLKTNSLDYDTHTRMAYYFGGGEVEDEKSNLWSDRGYYDADTRIASFKGNVRFIGEDANVESDSLTYNANDKKVYFNSTTHITTKEGGDIVAEGGFYDTVLGKTKIQSGNGKSSRIENQDYIVSADSLDYDNIRERGSAARNVQLYSKKDEITVFGNYLNYDGVRKNIEVYGNSLMVKPFDKDTLYLKADTIIALNDTSKYQRLYAYPKVNIYKSDMQARCDSLTYDLKDSLIYFHRDPVLWTNNSQLTSGDMKIVMKNNTIHQMFLNSNAFIIAQDVIKNFNQIKGKDIIASFMKGNLKKVDVKGNGESLYFMLDDKEKYTTALNKIICSNMFLSFADSNKLDEILFVKQPEGKVYPSHLIDSTQSYLPNFKWREKERPTQAILVGSYSIAEAQKSTAKNPQHQKGKAEKNKNKTNEKFVVSLKNRKVVIECKGCTTEDIKPTFFMQVTPKNVEDLPEEKRNVGLEFIVFEANEQSIKDGVFKLMRNLPDYSIKKLIVGQQVYGKGKIWQKVFENE